jgi:phosphate-selective porin OprO/OprP
MRKIFLLGTAAMVAASFAAVPAFAERKAAPNRDAEIQALKERIERLEAEAADDKIANGARLARLEKLTDDVQWSFNDLRPVIRTGDGRFELAIRGRFMVDFAHFDQDPRDFGIGYGALGACHLTNVLCDQGAGAVFRRARLGIEGKFMTDFIYELRLDFGGSGAESAAVINIARVGYTGIPGLRIHAGAIQPIMTMYDATSSGELTTMERPAVITSLVAAFGGDNGRRGVEATYQIENLLWSGDNFVISAAYTGDRIGTAHSGIPANDEGSHALGRIAYRLWSDGTSNIQIGGTYSAVLDDQDNSINIASRPEIRVAGGQYIGATVAAQEADAYGFEFGMNLENFYVAGEWYEMSLDAINPAHRDPSFTGWYVEGEWILTGENKRYAASATNNNIAVFRGPSIASPWSLGGGTGAWSLHARHSVLDLNDEVTAGNLAAVAGQDYRGGQQSITNVGVTWYINNNLKMMGEYAMVEIDRNGTAAAQENAFDADFDVIQGRMMFTF